MRFMRDLPVIDPSSWLFLHYDLDSVLSTYSVVDPKFITRRGLFKRWVSRYPPSKQALMRRAMEEPEENEGMIFRSGGCVKFEVNLLGDKPMKPRVFFPKSNTNLSQNGPLMYFIKHKLNIMFDGIRTPFLFGSGYSNIGLGSKFGRALSRLGPDLVAVELDLSMCETTMRGPMLKLEGEVYGLLGLSKSEISFLLNHAVSYGNSSKRRLKYTMPFCRESGTANTTVGNTIVFATLLWASMRHFGILDATWLCLVGGDDACIYCSLSLVVKIRKVVDFVVTLGLKPEALYHDNIYSGRFYGGRMLQVLAPGGRLIWVHTPLIGRALAKNNCIKYSGNRKPLLWLRDVTEARYYEWGHLPVLGAVNRCIGTMYFGAGKNTIPMPYREINSEKVLLSPCLETWIQLSLVYDVNVSDLLDLEWYLSCIFSGDWLGVELDHPVLDTICNVDLK